MSSSWSEQEREVVEKVIYALQSDKYRGKNYLFLAPFDMSQVPGYLDVIAKPLDLQTVGSNWKNKMYMTSADFWKDLYAIFENAIVYHSTKSATKWIAKMAKEMLKIAIRERKTAEGGMGAGVFSDGGSSNKSEQQQQQIKMIKLHRQSSTSGHSQQQQQLADSSMTLEVASVESSSSMSSSQHNSVGKNSSSGKALSLKRTSSMTNNSHNNNGNTSANQPPDNATTTKKIKIKINSGNRASNPNSKNVQQQQQQNILGHSSISEGRDNDDVEEGEERSVLDSDKPKQHQQAAVAAPVVKSKLKLKLSLSKTTSSAPSMSSNSNSSHTPIGAPVVSVGAGMENSSISSSQQQPDPSASSKTKAGSKSNAKSPKGNIVKPAPPRGKELPKAVAESQSLQQQQQQQGNNSSTKDSTSSSNNNKSKKAKKKKAASGGTSSSTASGGGTGGTSSSSGRNNNTSNNTMTPSVRQQCNKVLSGLRRRQQKQVTWFLQPVSDKAILQDYKAKIKYPMDLSTAQSKLEKGQYTNIQEFCLDIRRIFANALRYNTSIKDSIRPVAVEVLETAELLMKTLFLGQSTSDQNNIPGGDTMTTSNSSSNNSNSSRSLYPPLIFCWKLCVEILDTCYNLTNPNDGQPTVLYFLHPVSYYCGGKFPPDYQSKVSQPMDFGTVTGNLLEGRYQSAEEFASDCRLVISNCHAYYNGRDDGRIYMEQANRLNEYLSRQLDQLARYIKSSKGMLHRQLAEQPASFPRPPSSLLLLILQMIRDLKYTDKATKITEPAMAPFEKAVSPVAFPDYAQIISEPMDLQLVERKVRAGQYASPEDFEYDVNLVVKNCEVYNAKRGGDHLVNMAKFAGRQFRRLFYIKMREFEDPSSISQASNSSRTDSMTAPPTAQTPDKSSMDSSSPPNKKLKISTSGVSKGKAAPKITISTSQSSTSTSPVPMVENSKSPKTVGPSGGASGTSSAGATLKKSNDVVPSLSATAKANQPVPLHIAIARVKEAFPLRRAVKSLQSWEADCARYFKELMRHPWISAARPKFIFHVPVPILFPELSEAYTSKIRKPMDLTTVECTLLAGNRYAGPEDFVQDVSLTFANAVRFNKDGRDIGDPLSSAYYDASVHLLRYSRWLSLELLGDYIDDSDHVDVPGPDGMPPFSWKLTEGNRAKAREEMTNLVLKEPIEKSLEGDRYTWHESECEKLLKVLRHQSDLRYMTFFIQPNYPADYTAFIAKPMDWEKVQRTLKKRAYDTFGEVIEDLRLIFTNALKYNARLKGTDTVSGRAYEAAQYMSNKLEASINKLLLSVGDRLERERIDHSNAEREIDAAERAEEARIKAAWKKEPEGDGSTLTPMRADISQKIRLIRRASQRRDASDFEMPFFDEEDDGQHERSYFEVVKLQKSMFEKQLQELSRLRLASLAVGASLYSRHQQREMAVEWVSQETTKLAASTIVPQQPATASRPTGQLEQPVSATSVHETTTETRRPLQIKLVSKTKTRPQSQKRPLLDLE